MRRSEFDVIVQNEAVKLGANVVEFGIAANGHRFVIIERAGIHRKMCFALTPSGPARRGALNLACRVRRVVKAMDMHGGQ